VKAVAAHAVTSIPLIRQCVQIRAIRQRVMEGRIEDRDLRNARTERAARGLNPPEIVRIVERRQVDRFLDAAQDVIVDAHRTPEALAAVHHAMADRLDLRDAGDRHRGRVAGEPAEEMIDGRAMIPQRSSAAHGWLVRRGDAVDCLAADALVLSSRQPLVGGFEHAFLVGAHELELQRRRAGVEDEDVHFVRSVSRDAAARARASASSASSP